MLFNLKLAVTPLAVAAEMATPQVTAMAAALAASAAVAVVIILAVGVAPAGAVTMAGTLL